ncbi:DUF6470 family protein [Paenibacillus koleovorans]|uniref:DUF6470 family protein n=1 Tax=Paenibacillus koleovorans TaxID=121608 RepID=UPI000FD6C487|nr:DUF6470 family protein [Paenibacillus koleovorans]
MNVPIVMVRQTYAKLHVDADLGKFDIQQPRPTFEMKTIPAKQDIQQPRGDLKIDQTRAWDALALGNNLETMHRIYSRASDVAMEGIRKIVEKGNQFAAIHRGGNPIADAAEASVGGFQELDFVGEAGYDNVDITYTARWPQIETTPGRIDLNTKVNPPIIEYQKGKLEIYMKQYPKTEFEPPEIDMRI